MSADTIRKRLEAHADACRSAVAEGRPRPHWAESLRLADLSGIDLSGIDLRGIDLRGIDLRGADLSGADLYDADLRGADLRDAVLRGADLRDADLYGADLRDAVLRGADLSGADLSGADLRDADIRSADIRSADLRGADLRGAAVTDGVITAAAAGTDGGYRWYALRLESGAVILHYGCDRAPLTKWLQRGPGYGARHRHPPEHWERGPAVAIAAAVALRDGGGQ